MDGSGIYLDANPFLTGLNSQDPSSYISNGMIYGYAIESVFDVHYYNSATLLSCRSGC